MTGVRLRGKLVECDKSSEPFANACYDVDTRNSQRLRSAAISNGA